MIFEPLSWRLRGAVFLALAMFALHLEAQSQTSTPAISATAVFSNPRAAANDPRVGLKAGLYDAGEAAFGLERLVSVPKPAGFAPGNDVSEKTGPASDLPPAPPKDGKPREPRVSVGSANSDLAFSGNHVFVGNYNGISFYDADNPKQVKLVTALVCPGGQGDVSVYGNLLFMSAEAMNGRLDCGTQGVPLPPGYVPPPVPEPKLAADAAATPAADASGDKSKVEMPSAQERRPPPPPNPDRFRGVRIFDISDFSNPKQVAAVQSCRGSHTHTLVVDPKDKENVYLYISGTGKVRQEQELAECSGGDPEKNPNTALFRIDIVKVPLAHPENAKIVNSPRIFTDEKTGAINGLWKGGKHGEGTQSTSITDQCHDITVYSALGLAAGACSGNGILLDIADPVHPVRLAAVNDPNYAYWHSANFSNDGSKVLFTDEWGGGGQPRCRATDPMNWGADAIFSLSNRKLTLASYYKMPAPQSDTENCVAHNGSLVPIPGRDIEVQAWYQGGISMVDFTDPTHPFEIAYFDRGPIDGAKRALGGFWSVYWYNGYIYGSEIARGLDVFRMVPNQYITQNEIDAANQVHLDILNVQNQPSIQWPSNFIVARAYLDQLARGNALTADRIATLKSAIAMVEESRDDKKAKARLGSLAAALNKDAGKTKVSADAARMRSLAAILKSNGTPRS